MNSFATQLYGLIDQLDVWFEVHEARNLTSHTYNQKTAEEVYQIALRDHKMTSDLDLLIENSGTPIDLNMLGDTLLSVL